MFIQLTPEGLTLLQSGPFVLDGAKLGSDYNYVPNPAQTDIRGTEVFSTTPGPAFPIHANVVRYSLLLDRSVGNFEFGELGLFVGPIMVAIGVSSTLIDKIKTLTGVDGNMIRIDAFLSMVGTTYEMWINVGDTDNKYVIGSVDLVDYLPPVHDTVANAFIVGAPTSDMLAFLAYSDRSGLWTFDQYKYSTIIGNRYTIVDASPMQVSIAGAANANKLDPASLGERILQFTTGSCYSICRNIQQALEDLQDDECTLIFNTPLAVIPAVGDEIVVYNRDPLSTTTINIPIATRDDPGIVRIGTGLDVESDGLIKVNRTTVDGGLVYSIIGRDANGDPVKYQGDVQLSARDIIDSVRTVNGQQPDASGNVVITVNYTLPTASATVKGGVKVAEDSRITVDSEGFIDVEDPSEGGVKSINGRPPDTAGNAMIYGLIDPQIISTQFNANALRYPGLYNIEAEAIVGSSNLPTFRVQTAAASLEVIPMDPGNVESTLVQRWTQADATAWRFIDDTTYGQWFDPSTGSPVIATTSSLGSVIIGVGVSVTAEGVISTTLKTVNGKSPNVSGNIAIEASDINAIPYSEKAEPGGVATLDEDPNGGTDHVSSYVFGRVPLDQMALNALVFKGYWNATTNVYNYVDSDGIVHTVSLVDNGQMIDEYTNAENDLVSTQYPGLGTVLYTATAGSTPVDTITQWYVGDLVIGLTDKWIKVSSVAPVAVQDLQIGISVPNAVAPASTLFYQIVGDELTISNTNVNLASCRTAPTAEVVFSIVADGTEIGTITFDNSTSGIVDFPAPASLSTGSVLEIMSPGDVSTLFGLAVHLTFNII